MLPQKQELLNKIPPITSVLQSETAREWLKTMALPFMTEMVRQAVDHLRQEVLSDAGNVLTEKDVNLDTVLSRTAKLLREATAPRLVKAINATGIILHTGLGRAVFPETVVDSLLPELKGYSTLATARESGERIERDELVEYILTELTGAEAATVVNNNAAATMLVLAALAAHKEVIVSRGQLIEIGGSFRLPEVMAQGQARLVEVGATNRTHLKDYRAAITAETAAILRVHPSNYRVVGFTSEVGLKELAELAKSKNILLLDDLGAGALVDLAQFGLPHEPTVRESIEAGADLVLFSGDKLIGAAQSGIIVGRKQLIERLRKHPLMRAMRVDKTCLMVLERTLQLFRNPARLAEAHPTYRMLSTPLDILRKRAERLIQMIKKTRPDASVIMAESPAYLGSGSLPTEAIPSVSIALTLPGLGATELARRLRVDPACVFGRIEQERVYLDMRTVTDKEIDEIASALGRISQQL